MPFPILHTFSVTIPAGTPSVTPLVTPTVFNTNAVDRIEWRFPGGCNGQVGIQIGARSVPVLPGNRNQFFIRSGDSQGFDLTDLPNTGDWSVIGYNTGSFDHTIQVTFRVHRIEPEPTVPGYLTADLVSVLQGGE
jgi:hypothetical protein